MSFKLVDLLHFCQAFLHKHIDPNTIIPWEVLMLLSGTSWGLSTYPGRMLVSTAGTSSFSKWSTSVQLMALILVWLAGMVSLNLSSLVTMEFNYVLERSPDSCGVGFSMWCCLDRKKNIKGWWEQPCSKSISAWVRPLPTKEVRVIILKLFIDCRLKSWLKFIFTASCPQEFF